MAEVTRGTSRATPPMDLIGLARAIDALPDGIFVHDGPEHVVIAVNRVGRAALGHREIIGLPVRQAFPEDDAQNLVGLLDKVYASGEPFVATEWRIVTMMRGQTVERYVDFVMTPIRNGDGRVSGVVARFVDITDVVQRRLAVESDTVELRERYEAAQDVVLRLQRSLLSSGLPVVPGMRIAARYLVAGAEVAAGGDWFDVVALDGRLAAVVGDVVGHGAEASAVMGQLRAVLTELLHDAGGEIDLPTVLARLDRAATRLPGASGATVCLALLNPEDGTLSYVCAGHPPPLVIANDGSTRFLPVPGGGPLGTPGPPVTVGRTVLASGELLVCFSDGLVERVGQDLAANTAEFAAVASGALLSESPSLMAMDPADRVAELVMERMTRLGHEDDVTVLVLRRTGVRVRDLRIEVPAERGQLTAVRRRLAEWLVTVGAGPADATSIELAVLEAVANAMEHAYDDAGGRVRVEGHLDGTGRACLSVIDDGMWRTADPNPGNRGRGLSMIRSCMDQVEIERSSQGTTVLLDLQLRTAPVLSAAPVRAPAPRPVRSQPSVAVTPGPEPRVTVGGPVDISTIATLRRELRAACRGGALPLTVDLAGVTHLASAGIQLLYEFVEEMSVDGRKVALLAPPGTPACYALQLSGLNQMLDVSSH